MACDIIFKIVEETKLDVTKRMFHVLSEAAHDVLNIFFINYILPNPCIENFSNIFLPVSEPKHCFAKDNWGST